MRIQEISPKNYDLGSQGQIVYSWWEYIRDSWNSHQLHVVQILIYLDVELRYALNLRGTFDNETDLNFSLFEFVINFRHLTCDLVEIV